jgi:hypothetical protein
MVPEFAVMMLIGEGMHEDGYTSLSYEVTQVPVKEDPGRGKCPSLPDEVSLNIFMKHCQFTSQCFSSYPFSEIRSILRVHIDPVSRLLRVFAPD